MYPCGACAKFVYVSALYAKRIWFCWCCYLMGLQTTECEHRQATIWLTPFKCACAYESWEWSAAGKRNAPTAVPHRRIRPIAGWAVNQHSTAQQAQLKCIFHYSAAQHSHSFPVQQQRQVTSTTGHIRTRLHCLYSADIAYWWTIGM